MFSSYLKRKRYTPASNKINKTGESFLTKKTDTPSLYSLPKSLDNNKNTLKLPSYSEISSSLAKSSADFSQKASEIRNNLKNAHLSVYNNPNIEKLFDDIDDKSIEEGAKLSKSAIDSNIRLGKIDDSFLKSHPYLSDGLTMFYALSDKKKTKEANEARRLAYTEVKNEKVSNDPYSPRSLYEKDMERIRKSAESNKKANAPYRDKAENIPELSGENLSLDDADLSVKGVYEKSLKSIKRHEQIRKEKSHIPLDVTHQTQQVFGPGNPGCVLTCISMLFNYYGEDTTPQELYELNGNEYRAKFYDLMSKKGLSKKLDFSISESDTAEDEVYNKCLNELEHGNPVIVEIAYVNEGRRCTHSVLVYGYNGDWSKTSDFDPSEFLAMDPYRTTKNKSDTEGVNTLQHTINMFKTRSPRVQRWMIYKPKKETNT